MQFSVAGEALEYFVIAGRRPRRCSTATPRLTGRPARVPAWSYGLWLSTSFTTDYDEATVNAFIDGMAERDIPLSVFHFDCFWMREFHWTDFEWDPRVFPDPKGMLAPPARRGLQGERLDQPVHRPAVAAVPRRASRRGYLVQRADGNVWQWDLWQAGMALVDFTNPDAVGLVPGPPAGAARSGRRRHQDRLRRAHPDRRGLARRQRPRGDAPPVHRSSTTGRSSRCSRTCAGRARPCSSRARRPPAASRCPCTGVATTPRPSSSMAESLRGGLSLALSGFGYWSHDIGGFEGDPDPAVFKRWLAFGLLSSHSRLHGSTSYRVPWVFDRGDEAPGQSAVEVARRFAKLKRSLLPYLVAAGEEAHRTGRPVMRPMQLEFPDDPAVGLPRPAVPARPEPARRPRVQRGRRGRVLPAGGTLDELVHERGRRGRRLAPGGPRLRHRAALGARGRGRAGRRRGRFDRGVPRASDRKFRA